MSVLVDILDALMTRLTNPALTSPATPIAHPLVAFTPAAGTAHLVAHPLMPAEPEQPAWAFDSDVIHRGIFQVDAVAPDGRGEAPGLSLAALVAHRFAVGTAIDTASGRVKVLSPPSIGPVILDRPWARFPVSVAFRVVA